MNLGQCQLALFGVLALSSMGVPGFCQQIIVDEDFDALVPPARPLGWAAIGSLPTDWYTGFAVTNSCMPSPPASSGIIGHQLLCNDEYWTGGTCGITGGTRLLASSIPVIVSGSYEIEFDYYLDINSAGGDHAKVRLASWMVGAPHPVALASDTTNMVQGVWTHFQTTVPASALAHFQAPYDWVGLEFRQHVAAPSSRPGWALDNVKITLMPSLNYSVGCDQSTGHDLDGDGAPDLWCPCFNYGSPGAGCANSVGAGASISVGGSDSLLQDDLLVHVSGVPAGELTILARGNWAVTPWVSGTGISCLTGPMSRLGFRTTGTGGDASWGGAGFISSNAWTVGTSLNLMAYYRDPAAFSCNSANYNWSNSISLTVTL
ncbi:MAG: hypothetical protein ACI9F9_000749 [Candidatus Paceibacteria bacterium]|jgi:hypothetical protein